MAKNEDPASAGSRKTFWRSASWSSSRSTSNDQQKNEHRNRTSQQNWKSRLCLPPLQPLTIERRSLDEWPRAGSDDIGVWTQLATPSGKDGSVNRDRSKLDMPAIRRSTDVDKEFGRKDKECSKVADHVYLGGDVVAKDRDILKQNGITHILNCVGFVCPEYFKDDFIYRTLWLQDKPSEDITSILYDVFDYFEDVRDQDGRVFVHCCQGVSRSASLVIAYLMWRKGQSFDDAFQFVKAARNVTDPNMGFACQLLQCQKRVHAFPLSPNSLLRMYRIAPHSSYDPLHLVPKMLSNPSPSSLDSRGAFIINIPSAVYIWVGMNCECIMEKDARGAVSQIARYEKVHGSIIIMKEGEEPSYFWDAFSNFLPLMDASHAEKSYMDITPGERKVDLYDLDYEIFKKAITGGFVPPFASSGTELETHLPVRESSWSLLRRKFASGTMKEFLSAQTTHLSGVQLDSSAAVGVGNTYAPIVSHSSAIFSTESSPSSTSESSMCSSPFFLSPNSIDSDSRKNQHYFYESPLISMMHESCQTPHAPANCKVVKTNNTEDVTQNKRFPSSLAERRGSMTKTLKLPMLNMSPPQSHGTVAFEGVVKSCPSEEQMVKNFLAENEWKHSERAQLLACHWPSLERIPAFSSEFMTPKAAILFISPENYLSKTGDIPYLWIGRSYNFQGQKASQDIDQMDCLQKNSVIEMGLPYGTAIQIVREGEEPLEFLAMLGTSV